MLLSEEEEAALVNRLIEAARRLIACRGETKEDSETGLVHTECRVESFLVIEHQRQKIKTGYIHTNGVDLWELRKTEASKHLSVQYLPFKIKQFSKAGKAPWIQRFLDLEQKISQENKPSESQ